MNFSGQMDKDGQESQSIWVFLLLLFLHLGLFLGSDQVCRHQSAERLQDWETKQQKEIQAILAAATPKAFLQKLFVSIFQDLAQKNFHSRAIVSIHNPFPSKIHHSLCFFDDGGEFAEPPWEKTTSKYAFTLLWKVLTGTALNRIQEKLLKSLLGPSYNPNSVRSGEGIIHELSHQGKVGFLLWKRFGKKGGMLLHVSEIPEPYDSTRFYLSRLALQTPTMLVEPGKMRAFRTPQGPHNWKEIFQAGLHQNGGTFSTGQTFHRMEKHPAGFWIIRSARLPSVEFWQAIRPLLGLLLSLSFLVSVVAVVKGHLGRMKLLPRLVIFFGICFLLPALWMVFLDILSFQFQTERILEDARQQNLATLVRLDMQYVRERERFSAMFSRLAENPAVSSNNLREIKQLLREAGGESGFGILQTHSINGNVLFTSTSNSMFRQWIEFMAKEILRTSLNAPIPPPGNVVERMVQNVIISPRLGLGWVFDHPNQPNTFNIGPTGFTFCWQTLHPQKAGQPAFVCVSRYNFRLQEDFFRKTLATDTWAFNSINHKWYPSLPADSCIRSLALQALLARQPAHLSTSDQQPMLVSAYPSLHISDHVFVTMSSLAAPMVAAKRKKAFLGLVLLVMILLGFGLSFRVYQSFLTTITALVRGIESMVDGKYHLRIPDLGQDELGRVGHEINHLCEAMTEVTKARKVQQGHLPSAQRLEGEYEIVLHNTTATDLGGDYCDVIPLPNHRTFFIIGDVTGHGISASLVTVMMKTVCAAVLQDPEAISLERILQTMNKVLFQVVKRKKLMTAIMGILDSTNHLISWSCSGHPFPILAGLAGSATFLEFIQPPLGFRPTYPCKTQEFPLLPGESLILYSDGIVEAFNSRGESFGFERLQNLIAQHHDCSPSDLISILEKTLRDFTGRTGTEDDVTFLVIKRRKATANPSNNAGI
jgi:serine phosphatase RsbU (regulator of sigma subunit)